MATLRRGAMIRGDKVVIERGRSPGGELTEVAELEFAEVMAAARAVNEFLMDKYREGRRPELVKTTPQEAYEEAVADKTVPLVVYAVRLIRERARGGNYTTAYMALCEACDELKVPCPEGAASDRLVSAIATLADF